MRKSKDGPFTNLQHHVFAIFCFFSMHLPFYLTKNVFYYATLIPNRKTDWICQPVYNTWLWKPSGSYRKTKIYGYFQRQNRLNMPPLAFLENLPVYPETL